MRTALLLFVFSIILLPGFVFGQNRVPNFTLDSRVGVLVDEPEDVAVDSQGNIYFVSASGTIKKFHYHEFLGNEYLEFVPEGLNGEHYGKYDIAFDQHDNLFVVSYTYSKVAKFSPEGELLLTFGSEGEGSGQFNQPEAIAVNSKDEIYVADSGNGRIQRFDKYGNLLQTILLDPSSEPYFEAPLSIDFDADDNLYLLHNPENKVVKYSPAGEKLLEFGNEPSDTLSLENPWKLAVDKADGYVFVSDETFKSFNIYTLGGDLEYSLKHISGYRHPEGHKNSIAITPFGDIILADRGYQGSGEISIYDRGHTGSYQWGNNWQSVDLTIDGNSNVYLLDEYGTIFKFNEWGEYVMNFGEKVSWHANLPIYTKSPIIKSPKAISSDIFNNVYALRSPGVSGDTTIIYKLDENGKALATITDLGPNSDINTFTDLTVDLNGNIYVADVTSNLIHKIDSKGKYVGTIGSPGYDQGQLWMPVALAIDRVGIIHVLDYNGSRVQQFDARGNFIRQFGNPTRNDHAVPSRSDLAVDSKGNVYVTSNLEQRNYWVFNSKGDLLHEIPDNKINRISIDQLGAKMVIDDNQADGYSLYIADEYEIPQSIVKGVVYHDANNNCLYDEGDKALPGIVVATNPGPYYAITDAHGNYTLNVTPAEYTLHTILPQQEGRTITATCPLPDQGRSVKVSDPGQVTQNVDFGNYVDAPAHLTVSVSSTRRRRCFESTTTVRYENSGFATAPDAKVYVQLPAEVELLSANKTYTRLPDGTYEFAVGDLAGGQRGTITIQDIVTCGDENVRGRTVCTRAWITPSNNTPANPIPTITITGRCDPETGMIRFVIRNSGTADMEEPELFRKFRDGRLASKEQLQLPAGDSLVLWVPSMGYTWRLEADQPEGNGDNKMASVTIEGCTDATTGTTVSAGLMNLMPTDDEEAEVSEECMMITDSYDPNDKLVTPVGRTEENYTPTNTALKYKIRFQNTGTDVAYRVVVVDTLSEHLDLSTLQLGAASHTHRLEVSGKGRPVLTWTFDNIMLPDSNANEPGSHGYIQFSIKPKADLPEKTAVENFADIFFDYNSPVRTNVTLNRIYDMPPVVDEEVRVNLEDVLATPAIAAFAPAAGKFGTEVTITGKRFASNATDNKVYLNGKAATVVSATAYELRVLVPEGAATGALKVITLDGGATATESFEVYQPPVLSSFSPAEGLAGSTVTLQGQHLSINQLPKVYLGGQLCEVITTASGEIQLSVAADATTGNFRIKTEGGEVESEQAFIVWQQPVISNLSKQIDRAGTELRITGENFAAKAERNKVYLGQAEAQVLQASENSLLIKVPATAVTGKVKVITPGGDALSNDIFEIIPAPVLTQMQPTKGSVGTVVELRGQHFMVLGAQDTVMFNGIKAPVLSISQELLKVSVPRGVSTGKVEIKGRGGVAISATNFVIEDLTLIQSITVSPNPSDGSFKLDLHRADFEVQQLQVYSSLGQLVLEQSIATPRPNSLQVQLPKTQAGIYLLRLHTDRGLLTLKLYVR